MYNKWLNYEIILFSKYISVLTNRRAKSSCVILILQRHLFEKCRVLPTDRYDLFTVMIRSLELDDSSLIY